MVYIDFSLRHDKHLIRGQYITCTEPKGICVLVHGFGEHGARYKTSVIPTLIEQGFHVVYYDNIGHGNSGGIRGHCKSYESLLDLLDNVIQYGQETFPNLPLYLYGHSMGGNLVLNYAIRTTRPIVKMVVTSPYLRLAFTPPLWKILIGKIMLRIFPSLTLPSGMDPGGISRIPEEVKIYTDDPLVHDMVSPMYSFPVMEAGEYAIKNADKLTIPTLLLHGTSDPIIDYQGTVEFGQNCNSATLHLMEGGFHELHNDLCKKEMLQFIKEWL